MTTWQVALVREQGVEFGIILVRDSVVDSPSERDDLCRFWTVQLGRPVALLGERHFRSYGRKDIVAWLENVHPAQLPWRQMTLAA